VTLRLRLVIAIVSLVTVGLAVFGVVSYGLYARSQYQRVDEQLLVVVAPIQGQLYRSAGLENGPFGGIARPTASTPVTATTTPSTATGAATPTTTVTTQPRAAGNGGPPAPFVGAPLDAYGQLLGADGTVLATVDPSTVTSPPQLPSALATTGPPVTVSSVDGSTEWRVYALPSDRVPGGTVIVALPLNEVNTSLQRLVLIGAVAAAVLLALLGSGSWLILRRGLRPLEQMATSARSITAGDLSQRVEPSEDKTEVGQLGLALNTMLGEIEEAFMEREATERRLRQFLADASHELRTPLTSIQGFAELFRLGADQDHVNLEVILRRIEEESARMKVLVEDLLLLARIDETRPAERAPVDLTVLAADACSDAVALDAERAVTLDVSDPIVILGDQDHLRQAITNLITNALRHTPPGTPIEVATRLEQGIAVISVRDHGPGLDEEAKTRVFDRFWQADGARVGTGAGLGLAIVAGIAAEHGGTVEATDAEGGGACFTLRFPLNAEADRAERQPGAEPVR
jgi:two-component system OmpR family sensor kinase